MERVRGRVCDFSNAVDLLNKYKGKVRNWVNFLLSLYLFFHSSSNQSTKCMLRNCLLFKKEKETVGGGEKKDGPRYPQPAPFNK
jgi:hypothetical protein